MTLKFSECMHNARFRTNVSFNVILYFFVRSIYELYKVDFKKKANLYEMCKIFKILLVNVKNCNTCTKKYNNKRYTVHVW